MCILYSEKKLILYRVIESKTILSVMIVSIGFQFS